MIRLEFVTEIAAPLERCFDLARSIDLHTRSLSGTGELAIAGITSGLIGLGQQVTWRGRHFGFQMQHCSRITQYCRPAFFRDEMIKGQFRSFVHDHFFEERKTKTLMKDKVQLEAPLPPLGWIVERLLLRTYVHELLIIRNEHIRHAAEGEEWRLYLR
ncbi:MAG: cell division protein [Acidobacteria bacterium 13_1_20CM_4_56_7]|nr:MAG: cell division protein [Acidobacteria bacterium 13_1_20CM_4_56_7]